MSTIRRQLRNSVSYYAGLAKINKILPDGFYDLEVQTTDGIVLVDTDTKDKNSRPRSLYEDVKVFQTLLATLGILPEKPVEFDLEAV